MRVLDVVDNQLVRFEQEPNNAKILGNIFRLVHTIKGTCGFIGLPRLEALTHAAETLMGKFRDGMPVATDAVSLILTTIDRIKEILRRLETTEAEPQGDDQDLIVALHRMAEGGSQAMAATPEAVAAAIEPQHSLTLRPKPPRSKARPANPRRRHLQKKQLRQMRRKASGSRISRSVSRSIRSNTL